MARIRKATRENIIFFAGLIGVFYETIIEHVDRPVLLAIFAGMLGLDTVTSTLTRGGGE